MNGHHTSRIQIVDPILLARLGLDAGALGAFVGGSVVDKFGSRDMANNAFWQDLYPENAVDVIQLPTSAVAMDIVSTDANDSVAGTGARTVTIYGLDIDFRPISETVTLNGLTPVVLTNLYRRISRAFVLTSGASQTNEGDLEILTVATNDELVHILAGAGQTSQAIYCVPAGHVLHLNQWTVSVGKGDEMDVRLMICEDAYQTWRLQRETLGFEGADPLPLPWLRVGEKTDVKIVAKKLAGTRIRASFSGLLTVAP